MAQNKIDILDHDSVVPSPAQEGFTFVEAATLQDHYQHTISVGGGNGKISPHGIEISSVVGPLAGNMTVFEDRFMLEIDTNVRFENTASDPSFIDAVALFKGRGTDESGTPDQREDPGYVSSVVRHTLDDGFSE